MTATTTESGPIEQLQALVDRNRLGQKAVDILEELGDITALAEALTELATAIETARDAVAAIEDAEGRDERAEARDEAFEAIEDVCRMAEYDVGEADVPDWIIRELTVKRLSDEDRGL